MSVTSQNRKYYWLSQRLTFSPSLSLSFPFLLFYYIISFPFIAIFLLAARGTRYMCKKTYQFDSNYLLPPHPSPFAFATPWPYPTLGYLVFLATSRLISYVSGANGKTQLGCAASFFLAALISYLHRVPCPRSPSPLLTMPCAHFSASACQLPFPFAFFVDTWGRHTAKSAWQARSALQGVWGEGGAVVSLAAAVMHKFRVCYQI